MLRRHMQLFALFVALVPTLMAESVIIRCTRPCSVAKAAVGRAGGAVTHEFKYVDAIGAELTSKGVTSVGASLPKGSIRRDVMVQLPGSVSGRNGSSEAVDIEVSTDPAILDQAALAEAVAGSPQGWEINNSFVGVQSLHTAGKTGAGVVVAIIDSGIRPGFLNSSGAVLGGENFVPDALGFRNSANNSHGTFVGGMVGNRFLFVLGGPLLAAIQANCPSCVRPGNRVAMLGSAPASSIYALRVFPPSGGAPQLRIMQAMERVIDLRRNFNAGMTPAADATGKYNALNIRVCNMSLGGATSFAGRDIEDQLTEAFLANDIVLVTSAGNNGPSGMTGGSPGTGLGSLTVGAASTATHERILRYLQFGPVAGAAYRPSSGVQTAYFSARGPTADGRYSPHVTANGFASFSSNGGGSLNIGSGTSFSAPTVSGVAAVLRQAHPTATARQIRNAIIMSANGTMLADGSDRFDQGAGFVDAAAASALLASGTVPDTTQQPGEDNKKVENNISKGTGIQTFSGSVTQSATLRPGQRHEVFYEVKEDTDQVVITLSGVTPGTAQNALFGDDVLFTVHTAKTSAIGTGDYPVFAFSTGGTWTITNPDRGIMRVTMTGDWTNASPIAATVSVSSTKDNVIGKTSQTKVAQGDVVSIPFTVPAGTLQLAAHLEWSFGWGAYPTNDIDLTLVPPTGPANFAGATIASPERVTIANPVAGQWTAIVEGFTVDTDDDKYRLVIYIDGEPLKKAK